MKIYDLILRSKSACIVSLFASAFAGASIVASLSMSAAVFCALAGSACLCAVVARSVAIADFHRSISYPEKVKTRDAFLDRREKESRAT